MAGRETESAGRPPPPSWYPPSRPRARAAGRERLCWDLQAWTLQGRCCFLVGQASLTTWGEPSRRSLRARGFGSPAAGFTGRSLPGAGEGPRETPLPRVSLEPCTFCFVFLGTELGFSWAEGWHMDAKWVVMPAAATVG